MEFKYFSFRHADLVLKGEEFSPYFEEVCEAIWSVSDDDIINHFENMERQAKSISESVNRLLRDQFVSRGWDTEPPIFQDDKFQENSWRLDFAKGPISVEVAFNHGEATAWNLLKPVLASEVNHVRKKHATQVGIVICATKEMWLAGNFDNAVGVFEKFKTYFVPLQNLLTVPILLIGLQAPESFKIENNQTKVGRSVKNVGSVYRFTPSNSSPELEPDQLFQ